MKVSKTTFRYRAVAMLAVVLLLVAVLFHPGCGADDEPGDTADKRTPATEYDRTVGAATYVPQDVSFYFSTLRAGSRVRKIYESRAVQNVVNLPSVQQVIAMVNANPQVREVLGVLATHPLAVEGLPVLKDAVSNEVFFCGGPELPDTLAAVGRAYWGIYFGSIESMLLTARSGNRPDGDAAIGRMVVDTILADKEHLRVPSFLMGFKLTDVGRANAFLDKWIAKIPSPGKKIRIKKESLAGGSLHVLRLSGKDLPLGDLERELMKGDIDAGKAGAMRDHIRSLTLVIAVGVVDEYLMVSIGKDTSLLERWGKGPSLAQSAEFAPLRKRCKASLCDVSYASKAMVSQTQWSRDDVRGMTRSLLSLIPDSFGPKGLKKRVGKDADGFIDELSFPEPANTLIFSFENRGIESYSFESAAGSALDASRPLTILAHRGKNPIGAFANRRKTNSNTYAWWVKWIRRAYGYAEDYLVPALSPEDRAEYNKAMAIVGPFLVSVDKTTREYILPATDGTQGLVVIDGGGTLAGLPASWNVANVKISKPFPLPRLGIAWELNDAGQFIEGMGRYRKAAQTLLTNLKVHYPSKQIASLELPPPKTSPLAGGTLYSYGRIVDELGDDVMPCALIKGNLLVISTSKKLAEEMIAPVPMARDEVTAPDGPAGDVTLVNFDASNAYLTALADSACALLIDNWMSKGPERETALGIRKTTGVVLHSLKAFRAYNSTTTIEDGWLVTHSWLHVEDIPE